MTEMIRRPPPCIEDMLDWAGKAKCLSSFDFAAGYHQIPIAEMDIAKTAFNTPLGQFECVGMPFGMKNAQAVFQVAIEETIADILWKVAGAYVDDVLIGSRTFQGHLIHLQVFFNLLHHRNWRIKLPKSKLLPAAIPVLGHVITKEGVNTEDSKITKIKDARPLS